MRQLLLATLAAAPLGAALLGAAPAAATDIVALTADNRLLRFDSEARRAAAPVRITGADARVIGIDQRPQDGRLYGLTERGQIVSLDPATGRATEVSRLSEQFESGGRAVVDFNPRADRLRVMGLSGQNFRVNIETGAAVRDGELKFGEATGASRPMVVAGAYTNSAQGREGTMLLTLDTVAGALHVQNPPNDGVQAMRARLGASLPPATAFDILADGAAENTGFVLAGGTLHRLDLTGGGLTALGPVANLPEAEVLDIAAMR